ncbi:MAG: segregation/condensation protein A [Verrucomicrobia bacterium]|nr:segregation/condensation protein A [Verrucomicrobiota bacterium]
MAEYKIQLEVFEGPLDLLLYLIKKEEVDIYQVNLTRIATQFVAYLEQMQKLDLDITGEFLVMAATLLYIKSRELLPVDQQVALETEDDGLDPKWELIRRLVEYKKFKDASGQLQTLEAEQANRFARVPGKPDLAMEAPPPKTEVTLFDLINAVSAILQRFQQRGGLTEIYEDQWSVSGKIEELMRRLGERPVLKFLELFTHATSRSEVVATFLALLELIRLKQVLVSQPAPFGEIEITARPSPAPPAPLAPPPATAATDAPA